MMDIILTDLVVRDTQAHKISLSRSVVLMASISMLKSVCPCSLESCPLLTTL